MRHDPTDDELLRSYLLGTLPEEKADPLERRLLAEDELFELCEAIEADLLAAADRGELAPEERERVLRRLASSPQGRERHALARSLNAVAAAPAPVVAFPVRPRPSVRPAFRWAALAAGLLLAAGLSWRLMEPPHGGESSPVIAHERPAPAGPVTSDLPQETPAPPPPPPVVAQEKRPSTEKPKPAKVVWQLALMTLRGSEPPRRVSLPAGTGEVELQIGVEGMEDLESFHLVVRSPRGKTLLDKKGLKPQTLDGARTLVVELPAGQLSAGRYEIEAQGVPQDGGEPEDLSPLSIQVVRGSKG